MFESTLQYPLKSQRHEKQTETWNINLSTEKIKGTLQTPILGIAQNLATLSTDTNVCHAPKRQVVKATRRLGDHPVHFSFLDSDRGTAQSH